MTVFIGILINVNRVWPSNRDTTTYNGGNSKYLQLTTLNIA